MEILCMGMYSMLLNGNLCVEYGIPFHEVLIKEGPEIA